MTIPGIGPMIATAICVPRSTTEAPSPGLAICQPGLVLCRDSERPVAGPSYSISKRGNACVRTMLIHGALAAVPTMAKADDTIGGWRRGLLARSHRNVVVALAVKLARIAWSTLRSATSCARQPAVNSA